jgi:putative transposase
MRSWGTATEIAAARIAGAGSVKALPGSGRGVEKRAAKERWKKRARKGRGGGTEFHVTSFAPTDEQRAAWGAFCLLTELPAAAVGDGVMAHAGEAAATAAIVEAGAGTIALSASAENQSVSAVLWREAETKSQRARDAAASNARALFRACEMIESGVPRMSAYEAAARERGVSISTLRVWFREVGGLDRSDWSAALIDRRAGRPRDHSYDERIYETFKSDFLRSDRPPAMACYRRAVQIGRGQGVEESRVPGYAALSRRLQAEIPWQAIVFARKGAQALHRSYPAQRRDRSALFAGDAAVGDGYRWNLAVRWPDGEICRPLMWHWSDEYSGKTLAWRFDKTENWGLIRLTIGDLISEFCIPNLFTLDNTMAGAAKQITGGSQSRFRFKIKAEEPTGLILQLGSEHKTTLPRVGGSSKRCERSGGDFDRDGARHPALAGAWLGYNSAVRPEDERRAIPLDQFISLVNEVMRERNSRPGRRTQSCKGIFSYDEVFAESFPKHPHRKPTAEHRRLCLLAAESVLCRKIDGSIALYGNCYWSEATAALAGQQVIVRYDPDRLHQSVFLYTRAGKFIGEAECRVPVGFRDVAAARTHNRLRRQNLKRHKEIARNERTMTALQIAAQLPTFADPEPVSAKVVSLMRPKFEPPRAINFFEDEQEDPRWRRYSDLKERCARAPETLSADDRSAILIFEASAAYRVRMVNGGPRN